MWDFILKILTPFIKWIGSIASPWSHKEVTGVEYYKVRDKIEVGTIMLTSTFGELSNLINPEKIKHGGIYIGMKDGIGYVLEATKKGVILTDLVTFMTTKDVIVGFKSNYLTEEDKALLPTEAKRLVGTPYDYLFQDSEKSMYCFETIAHVLQSLRPEVRIKKFDIVKSKSIYSYKSYYQDGDLFDEIFDTRKLKENE